MHGDPHGATALARGVQYASEDRVATAALAQIFPLRRRAADGGGHPDLHLRLRQRADAGRRARLLRHEPRRAVLQVGGQAASALPHAGGGAAGAGVLDGGALRLRLLQPVAGLHHLCGAGVLHSHHRRAVCAAVQVAGRAAAVQGAGLSGAARALHRDGRHGSVSYYCGTSPSTPGRAWCSFCSAFRCISSGRGAGKSGLERNSESDNREMWKHLCRSS